MYNFLAIDDNFDNLIVLKALLEETFAESEIFTTQSSFEGIELAHKIKPDVILLDIVMPELDGFEVCRTLKNSDLTQNIPIIMITAAKTDKISKIRALDCGADALLYKPVDDLELKAQINAMLRLKEIELMKIYEKEKLEILVAERTAAVDQELKERIKTEKDLQNTLIELERRRLAELNLMEDLKTEIQVRTLAEQALRESQTSLENLIKNLPGFVYKCLYDENWTMKFLSDGIESITGYKSEELIDNNSLSFNDIIYIEDRQMLFDKWLESITKNVQFTEEYRIVKKSGEIIWVWERGKGIINEQGNLIYLEGFITDITEKIEAQKQQKIIYAIANEVLITKDLDALIQLIKKQLSEIIDTSNFFIAFYDEATDTLSTPYNYDSYDEITTWSAKQSLTGYVIKNQTSLLVTEDEINEMIEQGIIERVGHPAKSWLGIPLHIDNNIIGALVVQSYADKKAFNKKHLDMLEFISHQISLAIQRIRSIDDLKLALEKAEESDKLKTSFLANMSHEIRTPMNGILGFSDLLDDEQISKEDRKQFIEIIKNNGRHLLSIINDIIDIAKMDSGLLTTSSIEFSINQMMEELKIYYENEKNNIFKNEIEIILELEFDEFSSYISSDDVRLKQILFNLLSNALKFTTNGFIKFGYNQVNENLVFFVQDTGKGIAEDKQKVIFDRFRQEDENYTRQYGGTGLGLSISSGLVELLGGKMWVESKEGFGSTFYFYIPYNQVILDDNELTENVNKDKSNKIKFIDKNILVADDYQENIELILQLFKEYNFNFFVAENGKEAVNICKSNPNIDLVLMDIQMPELNGLEATQKIKELNPELPIIAMTAFTFSNEKQMCFDAGCNDYISKPILKNKLVDIISKQLKV